MIEDRILVVDDEKNIRITLAQALEDIVPVETAVNGEEALQRLAERDYRLILLDLRMPGVDGMEVLRRIRADHPETRVVVITAHGNVDNAVEAMKLGAVDFLQKPFSPAEVREMAQRLLDRVAERRERGEEFKRVVAEAREAVKARRLDAAMELIHKAAALEHDRPEVFNLTGAVHELQGDRAEALKSYRSAYWIAPSYGPSRENFERLAGIGSDKGMIDLGDNRRDA